FQLGLVCLPASILGLRFAIRRFEKRGWFQAPAHRLWIVDLSCGLLLLVLGCWALAENHFFHLHRSLFFEHPLATLPLYLGSVAALGFRFGERRAVKWLAHGLAFALVAVVALACLFDEHNDYSSNWHFTAVFSSVVQVHFGKALLINAQGQYGLYAHFLQPLFALVGLSVLKFTLVMGLLLAASYVALWVFLQETS